MADTVNKLYVTAKKIQNGKVDLEISMGALMVLLMCGVFYMVIASIGIDTYAKCDAVKGKKSYENLKLFMSYTLTIAITIPFTLLMAKVFKRDAAMWMTFYGIMGLICSAMTVHLANKCKNATKQSRQFSYFALPSFICTLLIGGFLLTRKAKEVKVKAI